MEDTVIPTILPDTADGTASLQDRAYGLLKTMIEDGRIAAGERLQEAQVARAFGISRSPARYALRSLCADKLIEESGGKGYRVVGKGADSRRGPLATLDPIKILSTPQWERMYKEVEQELFIRVLFGTVRINEKQLAEHFDVSRTVTRDLLARMHGMGLITKDGFGHWVAQRIRPERIRHLYEIRYILEPYALLQAAPHISEEQLLRARDNVTTLLDSARAESAAFDRAERDLHIDMLAFCPNKEILRALDRTHLLFGPTRHLTDPLLGIPLETVESALREHLAIIDHFLGNDVGAAAGALRDHLTVAADRWLNRFEITARMTQLQFPSYLSAIDAPDSP